MLSPDHPNAFPSSPSSCASVTSPPLSISSDPSFTPRVFLPNSSVTAENTRYLAERCVVVLVRGQMCPSLDVGRQRLLQTGFFKWRHLFLSILEWRREDSFITVQPPVLRVGLELRGFPFIYWNVESLIAISSSFGVFESMDEASLHWSVLEGCRIHVRVHDLSNIPTMIFADAEDDRYSVEIIVAWQQRMYQPGTAPRPPRNSDGSLDENNPDFDPVEEDVHATSGSLSHPAMPLVGSSPTTASSPPLEGLALGPVSSVLAPASRLLVGSVECTFISSLSEAPIGLPLVSPESKTLVELPPRGRPTVFFEVQGQTCAPGSSEAVSLLAFYGRALAFGAALLCYRCASIVLTPSIPPAFPHSEASLLLSFRKRTLALLYRLASQQLSLSSYDTWKVLLFDKGGWLISGVDLSISHPPCYLDPQPDRLRFVGLQSLDLGSLNLMPDPIETSPGLDLSLWPTPSLDGVLYQPSLDDEDVFNSVDQVNHPPLTGTEIEDLFHGNALAPPIRRSANLASKKSVRPSQKAIICNVILFDNDISSPPNLGGHPSSLLGSSISGMTITLNVEVMNLILDMGFSFNGNASEVVQAVSTF
ncbi:hypothetical protein Cni_G24209 [Canna indica]|uniref:DUF4283 domain-containing protein n=1 Tax=Canna indica TaxID=4628 RepID=A0AAQ3KYM2_9LILI|nr:hypothetical protein Cni_G24209 [Canna indica]